MADLAIMARPQRRQKPTVHPIDSAIARRSNVVRKAIAYGLQAPRTVRRLRADRQAFRYAPPIIANSIPKSGTHLLLQIARALPRTHYYGSFLSWGSSLDLKARSQGTIDFHLDRVVPGEALGAHLHYTEATERKLTSINALHLMIVRDYEDVIHSEAHYLRHMNAFHRMAREFRGLDEQGCINLVRNGSPRRPDLYPPFPQRVRPFEGWRNHPQVTLVHYEELSDTLRRAEAIDRIVRAWAALASDGQTLDLDLIAERAAAAIAPERSHTVSSRRPGRSG